MPKCTHYIWIKKSPERFWIKASPSFEPPKSYQLLTALDAASSQDAITQVYSKAHISPTSFDMESYQLILKANDNPTAREELKQTYLHWNRQDALLQIHCALSDVLNSIDSDLFTLEAIKQTISQISQIKTIYTRANQANNIKNRHYLHAL